MTISRTSTETHHQIPTLTSNAVLPDTQPRNDRQPVLSLCMIVRDNAEMIHRVLESIRPWVDEMIVVDTGSTDETPEICRRLGADVFHFPWCDDFSAARNTSLERANGKWIYYMDSDDLIDADNGHRLRAFVEGDVPDQVLGGVIDVEYPATNESWDNANTVAGQIRVFRNHDRIRFAGRLHENVLESIKRLEGKVLPTGVTVVHELVDKSATGQQAKLQRDLRILSKSMEEHPDDPVLKFYLGMTLETIGQYREGSQVLADCLRRMDHTNGYRRKSWALYARCLRKAGETESARRACHDGLREFPQDAELAFLNAMIDQQAGRLRQAEQGYRTVLRRQSGGVFRAVDRGLQGFKTRFNLGLLYRQMGKVQKAELELLQVLADRPDFLPGWQNLGSLLFEQNRLDDAEEFLPQMEANNGLQQLATIWRARLKCQRGDFAVAESLLREALTDSSQPAELLFVLGEFLIEQEDWTQAVEIRRRFWDECQDRQQGLNNLACLSQLNGYRSHLGWWVSDQQPTKQIEPTAGHLKQPLAAAELAPA